MINLVGRKRLNLSKLAYTGKLIVLIMLYSSVAEAADVIFVTHAPHHLSASTAAVG